jgi:hypothetical protein
VVIYIYIYIFNFPTKTHTKPKIIIYNKKSKKKEKLEKNIGNARKVKKIIEKKTFVRRSVVDFGLLVTHIII